MTTGLYVLPVPDTAWLVVIDTTRQQTITTPALPEQAPAHLVDAWRDRMVATLRGECPACGAVADPTRPPTVLAADDTAVMSAVDEVPHYRACPSSSSNFHAAEKACRGHALEVDLSPTVQRRITDFLTQLAQQAGTELRRPT